MDEFRLEMGAPWLDLLSTLRGRRLERQEDDIASPAALGRWLDRVRLPPRRRPTETDVAAAHALRDTLYQLARAVTDGSAMPTAAARALDAALRADRTPEVRVSRGRLVASRPADATEALGRLARQAAEHLTGPDRPRLRPCGDDTCAGIFADETGRRRWCNDTRCGSRARVRAHRARHR